MNIMDVTLRESIYYGNGVTNSDALEYLKILKQNISNKWIQYVEIGYINNDIDAPLNYNEDYFNKAFDICEGTYKTTAMMHISKSDISKWNCELIRRFSLVRVVVGQHVPDELKVYVNYLHKLDVKVSVNITYVAGLTNECIKREIQRANEMGVDYIFCADSSGSFSPNTTKRVCKLLKENSDKMITGIHLHDHMQMALANAIIAKECGVDMVDVSVIGAGKGGGNLKMELGLLTLYGINAISYELIHGLCEIILFFANLIGREPSLYIKNIIDFLTGLYRLSLKDTDLLEREYGNNYDLYVKGVLERFKPHDVE